MARSAVLAGRTIADLVCNVFVVLLMIVVGTAVGFRLGNGFLPAVAAIFVARLLGYSLSWVFALIGLSVSDPKSAQLAGFLPIFPLVFASSVIHLDSEHAGLASGVRQGAAHIPRRQRRAGPHPGGAVATNLEWTIGWSVVILAVFAPLAVRCYRKG